MIHLKASDARGKFDEYGAFVLKDGYLFDDENKEAVNACIDVFQKNELGLMIYGNPGSGKTLFFDMMQKIIHPSSPRQFVKVNVLDVVLDFNNKNVGHGIFKKWSDKNVFFDDLGTESIGHFFGEKVEVFEKFIQHRNDLFIKKGLKTHFTTNLGISGINERYGLRCKSRIDGMCVRVNLGATAQYTDRRSLRNFLCLPPVFHELPEAKDYDRMQEVYAKMKKKALSDPKSDNKGLGSRLRDAMK